MDYNYASNTGQMHYHPSDQPHTTIMYNVLAEMGHHDCLDPHTKNTSKASIPLFQAME